MARLGLKALKILSLALAVILPIAAPVVAAPPAAEAADAFIRQLADDTFAIVRNADLTADEKKLSVRTLVDRHVAIDYIAKLSLGRYGKAKPGLSVDDQTAFDSQLAEYNALFPDYIFEKLYDLVISKFDNATVEMAGSTPVKATDTIVHTKILRPGLEPVLADWRVRADKTGTLQVIDVKAEGVSLIITQRDDFAAVIGTGGLDRLLEHLRAQLAAPQQSDGAETASGSAVTAL